MSEPTGGPDAGRPDDDREPTPAGNDRGEAARWREGAAEVRDQLAQHRDDVAGRRDDTWPTRSAASDSGDADARQRDEVAEERDRLAEERDEAAEERDRVAERRDEGHPSSEVPDDARKPDGRSTLEALLSAATSDRRESAQDRRASAGDRADSSHERDESASDRSVSSGRRSQASLDRAASSGDRGASGSDRHEAGADRLWSAADRRAAETERRAATLDSLTGAHLRGPGLVELGREIARCTRTGESLAVAFVDVDGLKVVNDTSGHAAGDRLLTEVVTVLRTYLRPYDLIIRFGGDEFVCALPGLGEPEVDERMALVNDSLMRGPEHGSVTVGIALLRAGDSVERLIGRADEALYEKREERLDRSGPGPTQGPQGP